MTIIINLPIMTYQAVKYNKDYDHAFQLLLPKYHAWKPTENVTNFIFIIQMSALIWKAKEEKRPQRIHISPFCRQQLETASRT